MLIEQDTASDTITKADGTIVKVQKGMIINKEDAERDLARRTREFANTARQNNNRKCLG